MVNMFVLWIKSWTENHRQEPFQFAAYYSDLYKISNFNRVQNICYVYFTAAVNILMIRKFPCDFNKCEHESNAYLMFGIQTQINMKHLAQSAYAVFVLLGVHSLSLEQITSLRLLWIVQFRLRNQLVPELIQFGSLSLFGDSQLLAFVKYGSCLSDVWEIYVLKVIIKS